MTLAFPLVLVELGAWAGFLVALTAAGTAVVKLWRAVRRGGERTAAWLRDVVLDDLATDVAETKHLVAYHLGPNGGERPMHERVRRIEEVHDHETDRPDIARRRAHRQGDDTP